MRILHFAPVFNVLLNDNTNVLFRSLISYFIFHTSITMRHSIIFSVAIFAFGLQLAAQPVYSEAARRQDAAIAKSFSDKIVSKYDYISPTLDSLTPVFRDSSCLWGLLNAGGQEILMMHYNKLELQGGGLVYAERGDKKSYWLRKGEKLVPLRYEQVSWWNEQQLLVISGSQKGLISLDGVGILPMLYDEIIAPKGGLIARRGETWQFYEPQNGKQNGETVPNIQAQSKYIAKYPHQIEAVVWQYADKTYELVHNIDGKILLPRQNYPIHYTSGNLAFLEIDGAFCAYDLDKKAKKEAVYQAIVSLTPKYWAVRRGDTWGIIDEKGVEILPTTYQSISSDASLGEFIHVSQNGGHGLWDASSAKWLVSINKSHSEAIVVLSLTHWAVKTQKDANNASVQIYKKGNPAPLAGSYEQVQRLSDDYFAAKSNEKWGIWAIDKPKNVISAQYKAIGAQKKHLFAVSQDGVSYFFVNLANKKIGCLQD